MGSAGHSNLPVADAGASRSTTAQPGPTASETTSPPSHVCQQAAPVTETPAVLRSPSPPPRLRWAAYEPIDPKWLINPRYPEDSDGNLSDSLSVTFSTTPSNSEEEFHDTVSEHTNSTNETYVPNHVTLVPELALSQHQLSPPLSNRSPPSQRQSSSIPVSTSRREPIVAPHAPATSTSSYRSPIISSSHSNVPSRKASASSGLSSRTFGPASVLPPPSRVRREINSNALPEVPQDREREPDTHQPEVPQGREPVPVVPQPDDPPVMYEVQSPGRTIPVPSW